MRPRTSVAAATGWVAAATVPLFFLAVLFVWPVSQIVSRGFWHDGSLDLSGIGDVLGRDRTWRVIRQTLVQASLATVVAVLLGVPSAFVLHRRTFPGRNLLRAVVLVPFVLPTVVVGVAFRTVLAPSGPLGFLGIDRSMPAVVAALVFFNYGLVVRGVGTLWEQLDPRSEQVAAALGASPSRVFRTVTLPALMPAIAGSAAVVFLFCATAFGTVLVLGGTGTGTVETEIWVQTTQLLDLRAAAVLSIIQLVVVAAAISTAGWARSRRERSLGLVAVGTGARRLSIRDWPAAAVTVLAGIGIALPVGTLVVRSLRSGDHWTLDHYRSLASTGDDPSVVVSVWSAAATSLRTAAVAASIALVIGTALAVVVTRQPRRPAARRWLRAMDAVVMLPLGVSAVTVGFGFLITMHRPFGIGTDLRTTGVLVPLAQALVALPLVVRTLVPVLRAIDGRLREVAASLGSAPFRVLRTVDLHMAARSVGLAAGLAVAVSLGEFGATAFLARPDHATLPVVIYRLVGRPGVDGFGTALAASVLLAAMSSVVLIVAERWRERWGGLW